MRFGLDSGSGARWVHPGDAGLLAIASALLGIAALAVLVLLTHRNGP